MHKDLESCIDAAKRARDGVLDRTISVKEANAIANNNHTIVTSHAIDLRERIFIAEGASTVSERLTNGPAVGEPRTA